MEKSDFLMCDECGSLVADEDAHTEWHKKIETIARNATAAWSTAQHASDPRNWSWSGR